MSALLVVLVACLAVCAANPRCVKPLAVGEKLDGSTNDDCIYSVNITGSIRLWSLELLSDLGVQVVVLDDHFVAHATLYSQKDDGKNLQDTLCRRSLDDGTLETEFFLAPVGAFGVSFSIKVILLPNSQLFLDAPVQDTVSTRPHFFYFLLPPASDTGGEPISFDIFSPTSDEDIPYQLQVSWRGCPDLNLRDAEHQVLTFASKARMLVLDSQFTSNRPDVVYVGVRPRPWPPSSVEPNTTLFLKNLTITVSYGKSFASSGKQKMRRLVFLFLKKDLLE
jgi:hypothetical protein